MAEAIMNHQTDAFASDPYAAGTALYPDVGPALPEENAEGRLRQTRMIEARRKTEADVPENRPIGTDGASPPSANGTRQPNGVQLVEATPDDFRPIAPSGNPNEAQADVPPRRGTAVDPEPPPGSPEREAAEKEAHPEIGGPFSGLSHWFFGNNEPRSYPFDKIDTASVTPEQFDDVQKILREGKPGTYQIDTKRSFYAGQNFDSRFLVSNITLKLDGELTVEEGGKYTFKGRLGAFPSCRSPMLPRNEITQEDCRRLVLAYIDEINLFSLQSASPTSIGTANPRPSECSRIRSNSDRLMPNSTLRTGKQRPSVRQGDPSSRGAFAQSPTASRHVAPASSQQPAADQMKSSTSYALRRRRSPPRHISRQRPPQDRSERPKALMSSARPG
jgi:hypothetical protein